MKNVLVLFLAVGLLMGCENSENVVESNLTGNEIMYELHQGSDYNVSGQVTIKETTSKGAIVEINLSGTEQGLTHPVHLHYQNIAGDGDIAAVLTPIDGKNGASRTELSTFDNLQDITYTQLLEMEASIKVHLSGSGTEKNIILAGGNVGAAYTKQNPFGRMVISVCKSK